MLYIGVHISLISMTNKSGFTFFLSIKYLSVSVIHSFIISVINLFTHCYVCNTAFFDKCNFYE